MKTKFDITTLLFLITSLPSLAVHAVCVDAANNTTPNDRFTLNSDGTAIDNQTGLMWNRCSVGQTWDGDSSTCTGTAIMQNWAEALSAAENASDAGHTDWYLPNIKELASIVEQSCTDPAVNPNVFPNTPSENYWSSSPSAEEDNKSWYMDFNTGGDLVSNRTTELRLRLVRLPSDD
jgi:hypothetical protein